MSDNYIIMIWSGYAVILLTLYGIVFRDRTRISIIEKSVETSNKEMSKTMDRIERDMKDGFDKINTKMDTFFSDEITILKDMMLQKNKR